MKRYTFIHSIFLIFFLSWSSKAQQEPVELVQAKSLEGSQGAQKYIKLKNDVVFKQGNMFLYCDSAFQYNATNYIEAFGHVRLTQGDTLSMICNHLQYDGNTKQAIARGNVVLIDKNTTLTSDVLRYNRTTSTVYYTKGATIKDQENILKSVQGVYDIQSKTFHFSNNVSVDNKKKGFTLNADSLTYSTLTQLVVFSGKATITTKDGVVNAAQGAYHTVTKVLYLGGRARVASGENWIEADTLHFDDIAQIGKANGRVHIWNMKDSIHIWGDKALYFGKRGRNEVFGHAYLYQIESKDTLFLKADTLIYINDTTLQVKVLKAYPHVEVYKTLLQAVCDSLVYNFKDSIIGFYKTPILWNEENQLSADTIRVYFLNKKINRMDMFPNSFLVSIDTLNNFNQVKGKRMTAYFSSGDIHHVIVDGNAESLYHALEGDKKLIGVNKANAAAIQLYFSDKKLKSITYLKNPEASFIPPHKIAPADKKLKGFKWEASKRPSRKDFKV
ncbi:MAG: hypothetical protein MUE33_07635 [Cytophagaceae bacterium]|nr:hypothetical protein [Cytophagaceae bacterium]